jgi:hypothetical protein
MCDKELLLPNKNPENIHTGKDKRKSVLLRPDKKSLVSHHLLPQIFVSFLFFSKMLKNFLIVGFK